MKRKSAQSDKTTDYTQFDDALLMALVVEKDEEALEQIRLRYGGLIYRIIQKRIPDNLDREEVFQDVLFAIWRSAKNFDQNQDLSPWIKSVAVNKAISHFRHQNFVSGEKAGIKIKNFEDGVHETIRGESVDTAILMDKAAQVSEALCFMRLESARQGTALLSPDQRSVLTLSFRGSSNQKIADSLDMPLGSVKSNIRRGVSKLQIFGTNMSP